MPYLLIAGIIFGFNILSIWGIDGLITDDQVYYFSLYNKTVNDLQFRRNIIHALFTLGIIRLAEFTSIYFARLTILLLFSIPSAFMIFYFSNRHFHLRKEISLLIAVLPFIMPAEVRIPTYLVGSYILPAILFSLFCFYFIIRFNRENRLSPQLLILVILFYWMAAESSELIAFMLPVFLFPIFVLKRISFKHILLGFCITFIAIRKAFLIAQKPLGNINDVNNEISISEIKYRLFHFLDFVNPFHIPTAYGYTNIILILLILVGAIMAIINHDKWKMSISEQHSVLRQKNKVYILSYFYLLPIIWICFSIIPFIFFTAYFSSRYFTVTSIAVSFLFVISITVLLNYFIKRRFYYLIVLSLIIVFAGMNRQVHFIKGYATPKSQFEEIKQALNDFDLPSDAQIVIGSPGNIWLALGSGVTVKSNGSLQYILKRRDISGQIMIEKSYYDPFRIYNNPWGFRDADIDTTRKTILFRCFHPNKKKNMRMHYALRWVDDNNVSSPWILYYIDDELTFHHYLDGQGYAAYEAALDSLSKRGMKRDDIMFGGIPEKSDSLRLGL